MEERESLGTRFKRFLTWFGMLFVLTAGVVVTQRLRADALALLVGLSVGVAVMAPSLLLLWMLWRRQETRLQERASAMPAPISPPVVVIAPSMLPGYGQQRSLAWDNNANAAWAMAPAERKFTIVGSEP